jgi:hypothetical protein
MRMLLSYKVTEIISGGPDGSWKGLGGGGVTVSGCRGSP